MWASGWFWILTRWMGVVLCSYLVNERTHAPLLVQLVGAAFFAPMFVGGALVGVISDRFDRRRTILCQLLALIPVSLAMAVLVLTGALRVWMVYPFMLAVGVGGVIDMTSRRSLVYEFVGEERATNALALEAMSMTGGSMLGTFAAGAVIAVAGIWETFTLVALCFGVSFLLLRAVPTPPRRRSATAVSPRAIAADIAAGVGFVRRDRTLISVLGVTVLMNLCFYTYTPLVPVFAVRLGVNAFWAGVLGSASGLGSLLGAGLLAARPTRRRGLMYAGGAMLSMVALVCFALVPWYPGAVAALFVAGAMMAGFSTMQSLLVMVVAGPEMRGRAMGLLSMAIGALPFGMILLGLVAQQTGAAAAVASSGSAGLLLLLLWRLRRPEAWRVK
jgi:MFS family permease